MEKLHHLSALFPDQPTDGIWGIVDVAAVVDEFLAVRNGLADFFRGAMDDRGITRKQLLLGRFRALRHKLSEAIEGDEDTCHVILVFIPF